MKLQRRVALIYAVVFGTLLLLISHDAAADSRWTEAGDQTLHFTTTFIPTYLASKYTDSPGPALVGVSVLSLMVAREYWQNTDGGPGEPGQGPVIGAGSKVDLGFSALGVMTAWISSNADIRPLAVFPDPHTGTPMIGVSIRF